MRFLEGTSDGGQEEMAIKLIIVIILNVMTAILKNILIMFERVSYN